MNKTFSFHHKLLGRGPVGRPFASRHSVVLLGTLTFAHLINDFYAHVLPFILPALIQDLKISYFEAGTLALAISLFSGVLSPIFGQWSDRYAWRKRIIIMGFLAYCSGLLIMGLSASYSVILFAAFIFGLGEFTFHPQSTNFLTRNFPKAKGKVMGIHGIGGAIGNFSAPLVVTGLIALYGWRESLLILIIPGLLIAVAVKFILKEPEKAKPQSLFGGITLPLILITINFAMIQMFYSGFLTFLPTFLVETGSTMQSAGYISAMMLFTGFITQPLGGMLSDKFGGKAVFLGSSFATTIAMGLFTISSGYYTIVCIILVGASIYAIFPVALAMASQVAKGGHVGVSVGIVFGFGASLSAFTPMLTGLLADSIGLRNSFQYLLFLPICAFVIAFFLPSKQSLINQVKELDPAS